MNTAFEVVAAKKGDYEKITADGQTHMVEIVWEVPGALLAWIVDQHGHRGAKQWLLGTELIEKRVPYYVDTHYDTLKKKATTKPDWTRTVTHSDEYCFHDEGLCEKDVKYETPDGYLVTNVTGSSPWMIFQPRTNHDWHHTFASNLSNAYEAIERFRQREREYREQAS